MKRYVSVILVMGLLLSGCSKEKKEDKEAPVLTLKEKRVQVELNSKVDYQSFIEKAMDEVDGELISVVKYNEIDTSQNQYGTVINSQTLERAFPVSIKGVQRIVTIENKANYEEMKYREDTLYLFCHGFYSPKERIFLKRLMEVAEGEIQYFHWGDMDMGGIRIFRFNKKNIFPKLKPYKMDREAFQEALERGAGIPLEEKKKEKLEKLNAGELEELKKCILEKGVEIEQEILLAENAIAEN